MSQAIGYVRVGAGGELEPACAAVRAWCEEHGLARATVVHDGPGSHRPALAWALGQIGAGRAALLVVPRLLDLADDVAGLAPLLRWFLGPERTLVALDLGLDTSTEAGRLAASAVASVASARPRPRPVRRSATRGRPAVADLPEVHERIARMRERGMTLQAIADELNAAGVPTVRGGMLWRPSSVQRTAGYRRPSAPGRGIELPKPEPSRR